MLPVTMVLCTLYRHIFTSGAHATVDDLLLRLEAFPSASEIITDYHLHQGTTPCSDPAHHDDCNAVMGNSPRLRAVLGSGTGVTRKIALQGAATSHCSDETTNEVESQNAPEMTRLRKRRQETSRPRRRLAVVPMPQLAGQALIPYASQRRIAPKSGNLLASKASTIALPWPPSNAEPANPILLPQILRATGSTATPPLLDIKGLFGQSSGRSRIHRRFRPRTRSSRCIDGRERQSAA